MLYIAGLNSTVVIEQENVEESPTSNLTQRKLFNRSGPHIELSITSRYMPTRAEGLHEKEPSRLLLTLQLVPVPKWPPVCSNTVGKKSFVKAESAWALHVPQTKRKGVQRWWETQGTLQNPMSAQQRKSVHPFSSYLSTSTNKPQNKIIEIPKYGLYKTEDTWGDRSRKQQLQNGTFYWPHQINGNTLKRCHP